MLRMIAVALVLSAATLSADDRRITGEYVEARTAEVFAGGCIMNSEAETLGRQAVMAWRITSGTFRGVALDGLTVAAAVAGDRNLGMREMGGEEPTAVKAIIIVDPRATAAQRDALVTLYGRAELKGEGNSVAKLLATSDGKAALAVDGGHIGALLDVAFSPDGQWLASASVDNTIRIWDVERGQELQTLPGMGKKSEQKIIEGIEALARQTDRLPLGVALPLALSILDD